MESGKSLIVEYEILGFGFWNTAQKIRNPTNAWNPESKFRWSTKTGIQYLESGIHGVESRIQNCPGFPYMGRITSQIPPHRPFTKGKLRSYTDCEVQISINSK